MKLLDGQKSSLIIFFFGKYALQEYRYYPNDTFYKVSTAIVNINHFLSIYADITFNAADDINPELLEACEYKIMWTFFMNKYILRKCKNSGDQTFTKVAYISWTWGKFTFSDLDENVKYGYITRTDYWFFNHKW